MTTISLQELADRVHSLAIHLLRRVRAADADSKLTASRLSALSVVVYGGPITVGRLAGAEQVTAATMSRLVTGLERAGLVERVPDLEDGRRVVVQATASGQRALRAARARRVDRLAEVLGRIGPGRRGAVLEAIEILEAALADAEGE